MSLERDLSLYEFINLQSNLCLMLDIKASDLKHENLLKSYHAIKQRHPYLRMKIIPSETSQFSFKFQEQNENEKSFIPILQNNYAEQNDFDQWKEKLIAIANTAQDNTKSIIYFEIYTLNNRHQIFIAINHAGIDGPGTFTVAKDFLKYLDITLSNEIIESVESRPFIDIHREYFPKFDLKELKNENVLNDFVSPVKPCPDRKSLYEKPVISAKFFQFDQESTEKIIKNCCLNKSTVQGALCTAVMTGLLRSTKHDISTSTKFISLIPCNMRSSISDSLTNEDLLCASAGLTVIQDLNFASTLWSLSSEVSLNLKKLIDEKEGIKWWTKLKNSIPFQQFSIMSSSIGSIKLDEKSLKNIQINDLRFMGGAIHVKCLRTRLIV